MDKLMKKLVMLDNMPNLPDWNDRLVHESVSQHNFKMSAICIRLFDCLDADNEEATEEYKVFRHDCIVWCTKHALSRISSQTSCEMPDDVRTFLKLCDGIVSYMFAIRNLRLGDGSFEESKSVRYAEIYDSYKSVYKMLKDKYKLSNFNEYGMFVTSLSRLNR